MELVLLCGPVSQGGPTVSDASLSFVEVLDREMTTVEVGTDCGDGSP